MITFHAGLNGGCFVVICFSVRLGKMPNGPEPGVDRSSVGTRMWLPSFATQAAQREEIASIEMDESFAAACHSLEGFACCAFFERGISSKMSVLGCMSTWEGVILTVNMKGTCLTSTPLRLVSGLQHSGFVLVLCGPEFVYAAWCQMAD